MVKMLLLDDDVEFCDLLLTYLDPASAEVTVVHRVGDALEKLAGGNFSILLLDLELPDGCGLEVVRRASELKGRAPPIVALISNRKIALEEYLAMKEELPLHYIVPKPHFSELAFTFFSSLCDKVGEKLLLQG